MEARVQGVREKALKGMKTQESIGRQAALISRLIATDSQADQSPGGGSAVGETGRRSCRCCSLRWR